MKMKQHVIVFFHFTSFFSHFFRNFVPRLRSERHGIIR